jgi:polar amino acid transport system ATP-binding protein
VIDVKHLSKSFGDHLVLDDITEHIEEGEKVVIIGPSGSGKSTFLRCMNLLETPTKGTITFDGTDHHRPQDGHQRRAPADGHGVPALQPLPQHDVRKNITLAPVQTGLMKQDEADAEASAAGAGGPGRSGGLLPLRALRRAEAAHRHRAGAGHAAQGHAL